MAAGSLFFFSSRRRHTRCLSDWSSDVCSSDLWLEVDSDAELHVARRVRLTGDLAERCWAGEAEARTAGLEVVQDVRYRDEERDAHILPVKADILHHRHVEVPGGKPTEAVVSAATGIVTQYAGQIGR